MGEVKITNRCIDALDIVNNTTNKLAKAPGHIHCNVAGTYYLFSGGAWVLFEMVAGVDYYGTNAMGISDASDGSNSVDADEITLVY